MNFLRNRTKRANSLSSNTNFSALDEVFNQINTVLNVQGDNLSKRPRVGTSEANSDASGDLETKYLVREIKKSYLRN